MATKPSFSREIGMCFERPDMEEKPATAGFYNERAPERFSKAEGGISESINDDAFSDWIEGETIVLVREKLGKGDCVVLSLASPRRTDRVSGETYRSVFKLIGSALFGKTVTVNTKQGLEMAIDPATEEEIEARIGSAAWIC
jgi:enoyl-[acyl-carrier protein] reductase/trans-2-enoyl-CoA reductase (NAD+)